MRAADNYCPRLWKPNESKDGVLTFWNRTQNAFAKCFEELRQADFSKIKKSKVVKNLFAALLISEIAGLAVSLLSVSLFQKVIAGNSAAIGALTLGYFILDAPFDFILWPLACRRIYPVNWRKMYLADEIYFYAISKAIDPVILVLQNALVIFFISWAGFSETCSIALAFAIQIPPYIFGFILLCLPLIIKRDEVLTGNGG